MYRRRREIEWPPVYNYAEALIELQRLDRQKYEASGVTIEVNPISNLLVGDLSGLKNNHSGESLQNWNMIWNDFANLYRIGSDYPLPFATTLPEEYQILFDSLVLAGRSQAEAREWLEHIRQLGMESRFTLFPFL